MFDKFILEHIQKLSQQIGTEKRYVNLVDLLNNSELDNAYKTYFNAEVNWWIYEEQTRRHNEPNFDYNNADVAKKLSELDTLLHNVARFDRITLKTLIRFAVNTRLNYLVRPRTALKWFVFRGEPTKPYNEIIKRLSYFDDYDYLIKEFIEYVNENNYLKSDRALFSVVEFSNIIEYIDNSYMFTLLPEEFIQLLYPIFKFFNPDTEVINFDTSVPMEAVIIFFDDKGIEALKLKLESMLLNSGTDTITGNTLLEVIYELLKVMESDSEHTIAHYEGTEMMKSEEALSQEQVDEIAGEINLGYREMLNLSNEIADINNKIKQIKDDAQSDVKDSNGQDKTL